MAAHQAPVPGILQTRTLAWVAISFSSAWKWKVKVKLLSRVWLLGTPWTAAYQSPPSMGFPRQEYWSGLPLSSHIFTLANIIARTKDTEIEVKKLHIFFCDTVMLKYFLSIEHSYSVSFPCGSAGKESACNVGDLGLIPGLGRCPGEGKGYPL